MAEVIANVRLTDRAVLELCLKLADEAMRMQVHAGDAIRRFFGELTEDPDAAIYDPWDDPGWGNADDPTFEGRQ